MRFIMKKSYFEDIKLFKYKSTVFWYSALMLILVVFPTFGGDFLISLFTSIFIYSIASIGLMILTGYTGQLSLGHAAFFAIGSYTTAILTTKGVPFLLALPCAGLVSGFIGVFVALPALRLTGMYLAIATMGFAYIVEEIIARWESLTRGNMGMILDPPTIGPLVIESETQYYFLALVVLVITILAAINILRTPAGRAMIAIRDSEVAAQAIGVSLLKYKTVSFVFSAFFTGIAGCLWAHKLSYISPESFGFMVSVTFLIMIIIGGLGSIHGAIFGTTFLLGLPAVIIYIKDYLPHSIAGQTGLEPAVIGIIIMLFIIFEPNGLYGRWRKIKFYWEMFPLYKKDTFKRIRGYQKTERH
jgi:branched-chain amino acid transport system permease protein